MSRPVLRVAGHDVDRIHVAAGLRELQVCGYDDPRTILVIEHALMRWARGEETAAQRGAIDPAFHGIDLTCWLRVLAAARASVDTSPARTSAPKSRNRWNTIGRTRRRLAEILTLYVRTIQGSGGNPRYPDASVAPEDIYPMRLAGKARLWKDAHSWEAFARGPRGAVCNSLMSYNTMTEIVHAGRVLPIGDDGEVGV